MATTDPAARAPRRRRYNLRHAHRRIAQKARDPHLAGAVPAKPAHAHTATAALNQPLKQKDPPFCKRRSPNRPNSSPVTPPPPYTLPIQQRLTTTPENQETMYSNPRDGHNPERSG